VVAVAAIHGANDGEAVEHRGQLREVFAEEDAGKFGPRDAERSAVFRRAVRLGVERVDLARAACHPEENDRFPAGRPPFRASLEQSRQRQATEAGQARLEKVAPGKAEALAGPGIEEAEGVCVGMGHRQRSRQVRRV
jgi:hypothetical protein